jgi:hypothetical protein
MYNSVMENKVRFKGVTFVQRWEGNSARRGWSIDNASAPSYSNGYWIEHVKCSTTSQMIGDIYVMVYDGHI